MDEQSDRRALSQAMTLSLAIGFLMLALKAGAYVLTDSAAILSDAAESVVHLAAVSFAFFSLRLSWKPADEMHRYGHAKISFFSAGFEGGMILLAALFIIYESLRKWLTGLELENLGLGTGLTALATAINGVLGWFLVWTGKRHQSLILIANGKHVLTDCWTSLGVIAGLGLAHHRLAPLGPDRRHSGRAQYHLLGAGSDPGEFPGSDGCRRSAPGRAPGGDSEPRDRGARDPLP